MRSLYIIEFVHILVVIEWWTIFCVEKFGQILSLLWSFVSNLSVNVFNSNLGWLFCRRCLFKISILFDRPSFFHAQNWNHITNLWLLKVIYSATINRHRRLIINIARHCTLKTHVKLIVHLLARIWPSHSWLCSTVTCLPKFGVGVELTGWTLSENARFWPVLLSLISTLDVIFVGDRFSRHYEKPHIVVNLFHRFSRFSIFTRSTTVSRSIFWSLDLISVFGAILVIWVWSSWPQILLEGRLRSHDNISIWLIQKRFSILRLISWQELAQSLIINSVLRKLCSFSILRCHILGSCCLSVH